MLHTEAKSRHVGKKGSTRDATDLLKEQHQAAELLFARLELATGEERKREFAELSYLLTAHMELEEQIFYPAAFSVDSKDVHRAIDEHAEAKAVLEALSHLEVDDDAFAETAAKLHALIAHHVKEEEGVLFPRCKERLPPGKLEALADQMHDLLDSLATTGALAEKAKDLPLH